jgi:cob(I)alamin adenosyltransferase
MRKGYVQVYTGNGKGKTTASLGAALRAAGAGHKVFIGQFIKGNPYSELHALKRFEDLITLRQFGAGSFIFNNPSDADREFAQRGLAELNAAVLSVFGTPRSPARQSRRVLCDSRRPSDSEGCRKDGAAKEY